MNFYSRTKVASYHSLTNKVTKPTYKEDAFGRPFFLWNEVCDIR
jgi:hypothetical protein